MPQIDSSIDTASNDGGGGGGGAERTTTAQNNTTIQEEYCGTVREVVDFFRVPTSEKQRIVDEWNENHAGITCIQVNVEGCSVDDMHQLDAVLNHSHSHDGSHYQAVFESIQKMGLLIGGEESDDDPYFYDTLRELGHFLQNLPLTLSKLSLAFFYEQASPTSTTSIHTQLLMPLSTVQHLTELVLENVPLHESGARLLANDLIPRNPHLEVLNLSWCHLGNKGASMILKVVLDGETCKFRRLTILNNQVEEIELCPSLSSSSTSSSTSTSSSSASSTSTDICNKIRSLTLFSNGITELDKDAVEALSKNTSLKTLTLSGDPIGDAGAILIASALYNNQSLTHLHLRGCNIGDEGCAALAQTLQVNVTLVKLDLRFNDFLSDQGLNNLLTIGLRHNPSLEHLDIRNCGAALVTERGVQNLVKLMRSYLLTLQVSVLSDNDDENENDNVAADHNENRLLVQSSSASFSQKASEALRSVCKSNRRLFPMITRKLAMFFVHLWLDHRKEQQQKKLMQSHSH